MALCIPKHARTADENDDIFDNQAETLDELLTAKLMGAECLDELICGEGDFHGVGHTDADESTAVQAGNQDCRRVDNNSQARVSRGASKAKMVDEETAEENLFQGDLISCYLQEISRFPLLTPEREIELAKTIKEGQEELVALIWDERAQDPGFDELRLQLRKWQYEVVNYPGLREKMVEHALAALKEAASREDATEDQHQLLAEALEITERIDVAKKEMVEGNLRLVLSIAKRHRGRGLGFLDLIQEGNMGLLKAVARYDYTKGNRLFTGEAWKKNILAEMIMKAASIGLMSLRNSFSCCPC